MNAAGETTITLDNESIHEDDESDVELEVELLNLWTEFGQNTATVSNGRYKFKYSALPNNRT